jgi:hypothetical protein
VDQENVQELDGPRKEKPVNEIDAKLTNRIQEILIVRIGEERRNRARK